MLIKIDASQLDWRSYLFWSQDPVGIQEIHDKIDVHSENQALFKLQERLIAKIFLFRWIYWGPAYSYANDANFQHVSKSVAYWQNIINIANEKYIVLYEFQKAMVERATHGEIIVTPAGREHEFKPKESNGEAYFNLPDIVNWPNQGLAADLMILVRVALYNRLLNYKPFLEGLVKWINTVHDDVELDVDNDPKIMYHISTMCENVMRDIPKNFEHVYKRPYNVPMDGEVLYGPNLKNLKEFHRELGEEQFYAN